MEIDEALYQLKQNIRMHKIEGTTSNQNEREKALLDYITNLQEENRQTKLLKERYQLEKEDYKSRNEKAIENINLVIKLIKQQPTEDDSWILNKLNGFKYLLNDGDDNGNI